MHAYACDTVIQQIAVMASGDAIQTVTTIVIVDVLSP
jgi:hypothetical protein